MMVKPVTEACLVAGEVSRWKAGWSSCHWVGEDGSARGLPLNGFPGASRGCGRELDGVPGFGAENQPQGRRRQGVKAGSAPLEAEQRGGWRKLIRVRRPRQGEMRCKGLQTGPPTAPQGPHKAL